MRIDQALVTSACVVLGIAAASAISCRRETPQQGVTPSVTSPSAESKIERGRYLTTIAACNDCHTPGTFYGGPDPARTLAGSELGWNGPWGTSYPTNLTPDLETGIGKWTEAEIVSTIRTGKRPDGRPLLPPMPWPMYAAMSDADLQAVAAYLKSIPAVKHRSPASLPPGEKPEGPHFALPPPPAWDAPKGVGGGPPHGP